ncbi:hypothetical protein GIB67_016188 [Kingdonia uniflora]|uniref:Uncharacterized protein n=1 Tax=Kingdonia uniflora TaxID=39325 RepID=A0A7J7LT36_9MAGN|nr:hypothetical protein GIB67_016188 [Kingdonia uniflora]
MFDTNRHNVSLAVLQGSVLDEVHQRIIPWIRQIGPIPDDDGRGKEIATLISTTMKTNKMFYIDYNGRDFINRVCLLHSFEEILFLLQVCDYRTDWGLQVKITIAKNYYWVFFGYK